MDNNSGIKFKDLDRIRTPLPFCGICPKGAIILILNMVVLIGRKIEE